MYRFTNSTPEVVPGFIMSHGVPVMTKYMVAVREFADVAASDLVMHAGEIIGVLL